MILIERSMAKFLRGPASTRGALAAIVTSTLVVVVASGVLMRVFDHREYPNIFRGIWWAMQTVTTVGYGDVTPTSTFGRIVACFVMLVGVALIAIVTAAVTSTFVERALHARAAREKAEDVEDQQEQTRIDARLDDLAAQLERVQTTLDSLTKA
jgi:voltage-gated potassium channel